MLQVNIHNFDIARAAFRPTVHPKFIITAATTRHLPPITATINLLSIIVNITVDSVDD